MSSELPALRRWTATFVLRLKAPCHSLSYIGSFLARPDAFREVLHRAGNTDRDRESVGMDIVPSRNRRNRKIRQA